MFVPAYDDFVISLTRLWVRTKDLLEGKTLIMNLFENSNENHHEIGFSFPEFLASWSSTMLQLAPEKGLVSSSTRPLTLLLDNYDPPAEEQIRSCAYCPLEIYPDELVLLTKLGHDTKIQDLFLLFGDVHLQIWPSNRLLTNPFVRSIDREYGIFGHCLLTNLELCSGRLRLQLIIGGPLLPIGYLKGSFFYFSTVVGKLQTAPIAFVIGIKEMAVDQSTPIVRRYGWISFSSIFFHGGCNILVCCNLPLSNFLWKLRYGFVYILKAINMIFSSHVPVLSMNWYVLGRHNGREFLVRSLSLSSSSMPNLLLLFFILLMFLSAHGDFHITMTRQWARIKDLLEGKALFMDFFETSNESHHEIGLSVLVISDMWSLSMLHLAISLRAMDFMNWNCRPRDWLHLLGKYDPSPHQIWRPNNEFGGLLLNFGSYVRNHCEASPQRQFHGNYDPFKAKLLRDFFAYPIILDGRFERIDNMNVSWRSIQMILLMTLPYLLDHLP